ncbi:SdpI family protein [Luteococcus sp. H138]|uniref:SdpI family protein n=1 Tax=unclassified Luteococcus TaxID=2639923 RepID=UPI00313AA304
MGTSVLLASLMIVLGSVVWVLSWAAGSRRLRPGSVLGIRTPSTRTSDEAWFAGQAAATRWLGWEAAILLVGGLVLLALIGAGATIIGVNLVALPLFAAVVWCQLRAIRAADRAAQRAG